MLSWKGNKMVEYFIRPLKFIGLSGIGWLLDLCTYMTLGIFSPNLFMNNMISSWVGVTFVFITSTRIIFRNNIKIPLKYKYLIYLIYQAVLIYFISLLLRQVNAFILVNFSLTIIVKFAPLFSKIAVTPITMILNFLVMRGVIEKI